MKKTPAIIKLEKKKLVFIQKVYKELDKIKARATPEELKRLKFKYFNPEHPKCCIYGLMTGYSEGARAKEIKKKTFRYLSGGMENKFEEHSFEKGTYWTALEKYVLMCPRKTHKDIIKFLKGKIETIDLNVI